MSESPPSTDGHSKWSPIETAPQGYTDILLWDGDFAIVGHWREGKWVNAWDGEPLSEPTLWMPIPPLTEDDWDMHKDVLKRLHRAKRAPNG